MRSSVAKKILAKTPKDRRVYVRLYADIVVRIHELMAEKGLSQRELAALMGKKPSELSKWLGSEHNLTLRSLAKLQAALDEPIISVPKRPAFHKVLDGRTKSVFVERPKLAVMSNKGFKPAKAESVTQKQSVA